MNAALAYPILSEIRNVCMSTAQTFLSGLPDRAQIAAQLANIISAQTYALAVGIAPFIERSQLRSILLHSGVYNAGLGASSQTACCEARDGCWNEIPRRFRVSQLRELPRRETRVLGTKGSSYFITDNIDINLKEQHMR